MFRPISSTAFYKQTTCVLCKPSIPFCYYYSSFWDSDSTFSFCKSSSAENDISGRLDKLSPAGSGTDAALLLQFTYSNGLGTASPTSKVSF